ncbi:MAG TPA: diguanylate cyclase [Burkholderiaceae bacterium]|nr:diguanylate cyclase [Burkholderiaceae bacterium]
MLSGWQRVTGRVSVIVALLCAIVVIGIWLATVQRVDAERRHAVAAAKDANLNLAIAFEQQVHRTLKSAEQVASFVREQYLRDPGSVNLRQWLEDGLIREDIFTIITVADERGDALDSTMPEVRVNYADRPFFMVQRDTATDRLYVNAPVVGRVSGQVRIPMSLRMTRDDGSFAGIVVMSVTPEDFTAFYKEAYLGGQDMLELIGLDGVVRSRKVGADSGLISSESSLARLDLLEQARDGGYVHDGRGLDGVARIVAYRKVEDYPLVVAVGTSHSDELAPVEHRRRYYLMVATAATVVVFLFGFLLIMLLQRSRRAAESLAESEALYRATFDQAATGIAHVTRDGRILGANRKLHEMLGFEKGELIDRSLFGLIEPGSREEARRFAAQRQRTTAEDASPETERQYLRKDGSPVWVCETWGVVRTQSGEVAYLVVVMQDITARKALEARLAHDAMHDVLTGLPNRNMFHDRLEHALASARRHDRMAGVLYIDLDGFKEVNDNFGHAVGDALLKQVALRLHASMRAEDTVARFGGDEFAVVLFSIAEPEDCALVARKLEQALTEPFVVAGCKARISASIGAAVFPVDGNDADSLILHADQAMYAAKREREAFPQ